MESSSANTTNMQSATYVSTPNVSETAVQPQQQPTAVNNVDMVGGAESKTTETTVDTPKVKFDTENKPLSASYVKNHMSWFGQKIPFTANQNGDEYNLSSSLKNQELLTLSFKNNIKRNMADQEGFRKSQQLFENLDNTNYRYMHHPVLGNMRVQIDADGKDIGFPEPIDASGNKFFMEDPKNLPTFA